MRIVFGKCYCRSREKLRIICARLRVHWYRLLGADIYPKSLFDAGVRLEYPWRISAGERCSFQRSVWLNLGGETARLEIGKHVFIGRFTEIEVSDCVKIGSHVLIAPGVFITDHNHSLSCCEPIDMQPCSAQPVVICDDVWIGANAVILPGVQVGKGAVVGAGAVVTRSVGPHIIVAGVPAKPIGKRF
jgi:acetyltransferase-like isoleucine patch superfamily enzyme